MKGNVTIVINKGIRFEIVLILYNPNIKQKRFVIRVINLDIQVIIVPQPKPKPKTKTKQVNFFGGNNEFKGTANFMKVDKKDVCHAFTVTCDTGSEVNFMQR